MLQSPKQKSPVKGNNASSSIGSKPRLLNLKNSYSPGNKGNYSHFHSFYGVSGLIREIQKQCVSLGNETS